MSKPKRALRDVYEESCRSGGVHPNSEFRRMLPDRPGAVLATDTLDLSTNFFGDRGILPVMTVVQRSPQLRRLALSGVGVRNSGVRSVVATCLRHPGITSIDLSDNYISQGAGRALQQLLQENPRVVDVGVSNTRLDAVAVDSLLTLQERNQARLLGL